MLPDRSEWAFKLRIGLIEEIARLVYFETYDHQGNRFSWTAGLCRGCDQVCDLEDLEIDHPKGRTWYGRKLNCLDRIRRQWREYDRGVCLRALCRGCNAADGANRRPRYKR